MTFELFDTLLCKTLPWEMRMIEYVMDIFNVVEKNWNVDEKWNKVPFNI